MAKAKAMRKHPNQSIVLDGVELRIEYTGDFSPKAFVTSVVYCGIHIALFVRDAVQHEKPFDHKRYMDWMDLLTIAGEGIRVGRAAGWIPGGSALHSLMSDVALSFAALEQWRAGAYPKVMERLLVRMGKKPGTRWEELWAKDRAECLMRFVIYESFVRFGFRNAARAYRNNTDADRWGRSCIRGKRKLVEAELVDIDELKRAFTPKRKRTPKARKKARRRKGA